MQYVISFRCLTRLFSFELGGGPAVLISKVKVNDGKDHVIVARKNGRDGVLKVDGTTEVRSSSAGTLKQLNGNGNIYIGEFTYLSLSDHTC